MSEYLEITNKLDKLLAKDRVLEILKVLIPPVVALLAVFTTLGGVYLTYITKDREMTQSEDRHREDMRQSEVRYAEQLKGMRLAEGLSVLKDADKINPEYAQLLADQLMSEGHTTESSPALKLLVAVASREATAISQTIVDEYKANPEGGTRIAELGLQGTDSESEKEVSLLVNSSDLSDAQKEEFSKAIFLRLLRDIGDSPTSSQRIKAIIDLDDNWQNESYFVDELINAAKGKALVFDGNDLNIRVLNTLYLFQRIRPEVLKANEDRIRSWITEEVFQDGVGDLTQEQGRRVLARI